MKIQQITFNCITLTAADTVQDAARIGRSRCGDFHRITDIPLSVK